MPSGLGFRVDESMAAMGEPAPGQLPLQPWTISGREIDFYPVEATIIWDPGDSTGT